VGSAAYQNKLAKASRFFFATNRVRVWVWVRVRVGLRVRVKVKG